MIIEDSVKSGAVFILRFFFSVCVCGVGGVDQNEIRLIVIFVLNV